MHGGDIYRNQVRLDFSVNTNPYGIPDKIRAALQEAVEEAVCYPDLKAEKLHQAVSRMSGVDRQHIVCGNGASELFMALIASEQPREILIPVPSFSGYVWAAGSCKIRTYPMKEENGFVLDDGIFHEITEETDLILLANPNNPVGNMVLQELLKRLLAITEQKGITLVVDECFFPFTGEDREHSMLAQVEKAQHLVVVRAFTKIFAIPGVRLGYLVCGSVEKAEKIRRHLPEWNLSVFAQRAGVAAEQELDFAEKTAEAVRMERTYLQKGLEDLGCRVYRSQSNFLLFYSPFPWYEKLLERQILIRDCSDYRGLSAGYCRVAVRQHTENRMLLETMKTIREVYHA